MKAKLMDVKEIESAISQLPSSELPQLAAWFVEFHAQAWDTQIEQDVQAGRLDAVISQAEQEYDAGRAMPL